MRLYDQRIGRWLSTDPYGQYFSPYVGMGNDWVNGVDPDGGLFGGIRSRISSWVNGGTRTQFDGDHVLIGADGSVKNFGGNGFNGKAHPELNNDGVEFFFDGKVAHVPYTESGFGVFIVADGYELSQSAEPMMYSLTHKVVPGDYVQMELNEVAAYKGRFLNLYTIESKMSRGVAPSPSMGSGIYKAYRVANGLKATKKLSFMQGVRRLRRGEDVYCTQKQVASQLQNKASGGSIFERAHGGGASGYFKHFHSKMREYGHAFFGNGTN